MGDSLSISEARVFEVERARARGMNEGLPKDEKKE